jgi:hypothetical protein
VQILRRRQWSCGSTELVEVTRAAVGDILPNSLRVQRGFAE